MVKYFGNNISFKGRDSPYKPFLKPFFFLCDKIIKGKKKKLEIMLTGRNIYRVNLKYFKWDE